MKKFLLTVVAFLALSSTLFAQTTATAASKFIWDEVNQTLTVATGATYNLYADGATTGSSLASVTCAAGSPTTTSTCQAPIPAFTAGNHTATVTQVISGAESAKSNVLSFTFVVVVTPSGLRLGRLIGFWHGGVLSSRGRELLKRQHVYLK